ncbi:MAG: hypothetical protein HWD83_10315 [Gammaproteobacteria bacterium]|nr:hypothetical protein [Gammaproteobacteria bacterium]
MIAKILASLEHDFDELTTECTFPMLGDDVLVVFDAAHGDTVSEKQKAEFEWLHQNIEKLYPQVEAQVFAYYQSEQERHRAQLTGDADRAMPLLQNQSDVWSQVTHPGIWIRSDEKNNEIHLEYECSFDKDDGLRVVIANREIERVGI